MGDLVVCAQKEWNDGNWSLAAEPPSGQLNPLNEHVYDVSVEAPRLIISTPQKAYFTYPFFQQILEKVYEDMLKAFTLDNQPVSMFHMGGDEVNFPCWAKDAKIREWVAGKAKSLGLRSSEVSEDPANPDTNPDGYLELWSQFQAKARSRLVAANKGKKFKHDQIVWTSELAKAENIEKYDIYFLNYQHGLCKVRSVLFNSVSIGALKCRLSVFLSVHCM